MFRMASYVSAPAFVLLMGSTASFALTAEEVWQSWKDAAALAGLEVTAATENLDGGVLTLNGVSVAPAGMPGVTISDMVMTEARDGSVTIEPGADIGMRFAGDTTGSARIVHEGLTLVAREAEGGVAYDFTADKLDVVYDTSAPGVSFDGSEAAPVASSGTVGFAGLTGNYSDVLATNRTLGLALAAEALIYNTAMDDPGLELKQTTTSETQGVELAVEFVLPSTISLGDVQSGADFRTALDEGLAVSFTSKQGTSIGTMEQESPFMPMTMAINAGGGEGTGLFNKDTFSVRSTSSGLAIEGTSGMMPVPIKVTTGPIEFGMVSPVVATEAAGDFGLVMKLSQFALNEEAWAMVDPGGALSREAADLAIDISGKTILDLPAIIDADTTGAVPPVPAPESLNINELALKVAGAALAGTGAFTFDNSMGMPMPLGEANVTVTGATALIEGLIATGLMTEEDAIGARMMMAAFMAPGANPDELTSKIEAKPGFEILVNGQRIQ